MVVTPSSRPVIASMSNWIDYALAQGVKKVDVLSEFKRHIDSPVTDFYRPVREAMIIWHSKGLEPERIYGAMMKHVKDARALKIFPQVYEGHQRFMAAYPKAPWMKPVGGLLPAGPGVSIMVNPELGLVLKDEPHHIKLYMRSEPLSQNRVDIMVALMALALEVPAGHHLAVLDVRNARLHYLSKKGADPAGWRKLSVLVAAEAAAYAEAWGRV